MLKLFSPAKINFFLRILGRRTDGYHELASLFQAVDLGDTMTFDLASSDHITCSDSTLACDNSNLICKAIALFRRKSGLQFNVQIHLEKKIPMQAGLGGGSSNAATTLWALNALNGCLYTEEELQAFSSEIGSDIPFFFSHGSAYCTGRGEVVRNLMPLRLNQPLSLYKPPEGISTLAVYKSLQSVYCTPIDPEKLLEDFYADEPFFHNDLEKPAFHLMPQLSHYRNKLHAQGLKQVTLSGSGTTFFGFGNGAIPVECINRSANRWYLQ